MTTNNTQIQAVVFDWAGTTVDFVIPNNINI